MKSNYDKFPATLTKGSLFLGWEKVMDQLKTEINKERFLLVFDIYIGINTSEFLKAIETFKPLLFINTSDLFIKEEEVLKITSRFMTNDSLFGFRTNLAMIDYFDPIKLEKARQAIKDSNGLIIVFGSGAELVDKMFDKLIYADLARWESQLRFRKQSAPALGTDDSKESFAKQYKRAYFNDWIICDQHKKSLFNKVDYWIDTHVASNPKMIDKETFFNGIHKTIEGPFRVVPFFDPAPWGGQWMKKVCDLDQNTPNYGWCFDGVPSENSLLLNINGDCFEMPSINLVFLKSSALLGESVKSRFGDEFPIRFDLLDTMGGGNLSLQVHPTTQFIRDNFGIQYTQDESYYILDAKEDAFVYLGLQTGIDKENMINDLHEAEQGKIIFDTDKYINKIPAKKHDHFLLPAGTVHCSGANTLVLEISATPSLFTFKLWDWQRLGLDNKPRPINIERGKEVINWEYQTDYVYKNMVNTITPIAEGKAWKEESTGLHPNEFIESRRHWFTEKVTHKTNNSVNLINLITGDEVVVESPDGKFEPFHVHYAETFIVPASVENYTITPFGTAIGQQCATIKAYVRI
ncbi:class I mannose-6-phosphate isomerase [Flavobacterium sp. GT2N3]|uniref:class I mannose-6-phosphate isomerase n=1 Tax=unclassified Flavobacterium TaxID=196869 RepID=UPI003AAA44AE